MKYVARIRSGLQLAAALLAVAAFGFLCPGCATSNAIALGERVGPLTGAPGKLSGRGVGYLQVYTATVQIVDGGVVYLKHSPYVIYGENGRKVKSVTNSVGPNDQKPMTVTLEPGDYLVYGRADGIGQVRVPVRIAASRLTVVHLEFADLPEKDTLGPSDRVTLPDGRVVGRRAEP